jgi:hypothetical protein
MATLVFWIQIFDAVFPASKQNVRSWVMEVGPKGQEVTLMVRLREYKV